MQRGKFISIEGIDRSGKSLQAGRLAEWLRESGIPCLLTFQPGATDFGSRLRPLLLDGSIERQAMTCALLFAADRHEHATGMIEPALSSGKWVVCDRFGDSMLAYQQAQGLDRSQLASLNELCCRRLQPDLTLLLRIRPDISAGRGGERDYFDRGDPEYLRRVGENFDQLAADEPGRFAVIDAEQSPDRVAELVRQAVAGRLPVADR